jgi:cytochrome c peroxidase
MHVHHRALVGIALGALICLSLAFAATAMAGGLTKTEKLGELLFFDKHLSEPAGQACAACHSGNVGWTGPDQFVNLTGAVYPGAVEWRFGNRKPPAAAYAGYSPTLHFVDSTTGWVGGMFWDGRATGATLGDPLAEQAQGPFLNPLEQNNPSAAAVVAKVQASRYAPLFQAVWGQDIFNEPTVAYEKIARSIAAFERSSEVSSFSSKYDAYLAGRAKLTAAEKSGMALFNGKANCSNCHVSTGVGGVPPLFTDYSYDNLGVPKNPLNPFYTEPAYNPLGASWVDEGLGGYLATVPELASQAASEMGKFKVPTLRNVAKKPYPGYVKAYGHNGYFKSLWAIVHFYNTRDILPWPAPEVAANVNSTELGNLGLTRHEEDDIVAFLRTLSDGYRAHAHDHHVAKHRR